jgi:tetrachlorobenzoquinone reductase
MTASATPAIRTANELALRLHSIRYEAHDIVSLEWQSADGNSLPDFTAGAHIDLQLGAGLTRSYSLINPQHERNRYVIAVKRDPASRGGSRFIHENLRVGSVLAATAPRNHFRVEEDAPHSILFAGGIGITPLWAMVQRLAQLGRSWELRYCARTPHHAAFAAEARALASGGRGILHCHYDQDNPLDLSEAITHAAGDTHLYCCGPAPMLDAFERACAGRDPATVHLERFTAVAAAQTTTMGAFTVTLARAGRSLCVEPGQTILDALLKAGLTPPFSCREGICGSCETRVLDGVPEHRDSVLSATERASNRTIMICCSGCKGDALVLDL